MDQSVGEEAIEESVAHGGVVLLWVAQRCRRQGIASTLLDVARYIHSIRDARFHCPRPAYRRCFIFGYCITKDQLAFYQPTSLGQTFARHYCQGEPLVYRTASRT